MMACGVPVGGHSANQLSMSKPGYIESNVGSSGNTDDLRLVVTSNARILPATTCERALVTAGKPISVSPLTSARVDAPAVTPRVIVDRVHTEVVKALASAKMRETMEMGGQTPVGSTPVEVRGDLAGYLKEMALLVKETGVKPL